MAEWGAIYEKGKSYEINFCSAKYEEAKAVEKVCCAIMDKKVSTPDDVQIVRHGKWTYLFSNSTGNVYRCSNCTKWYNQNQDDVRGFRIEENPDYCPHCGAKMDGE